MKNIILIAIVFFTLNATAQEQKAKVAKEQKTKVIQKKKDVKIEHQSRSVEQMSAAKTKKLTHKLELTSDQQKKVYDVILGYTKEELNSKLKIKEKNDSDQKIDRQESKKKFMIQRDEKMEIVNNKFKDILTPEQFKKYLELNDKSKHAKRKLSVKKN